MIRNSKSGSAREPLITEHLEDLNRELELLRKKRLMIEQSQRMLSDDRFGRERQFNYNKSHQTFGHQESGHSKQLNDDYSFFNYYDERPNDYYTRSGRKRQSSDPHWEANVPKKRFAGSQRSKQKVSTSSRGQRSMKRSNEATAPTPLLEKDLGFKPFHAVNRPTEAKATRTSDNYFKPNKITKPKPAPVSNKLHTHTSNEVKGLVTASSELVEKVKVAPISNIYFPDKEPTKQMIGRMELALGAILKEMKAKFSDTHPTVINSMPVLRHIKQNIRERIRSVMIGKPIDKVPDIIDAYRAKFPKETDKEIMELAMDYVQAKIDKTLVLKLEDAENPEQFFEVNIRHLLRNRLDVMFGKLKIMYENEYKNYETKRDEATNALSVNLNNSQETATTSTDIENASIDDPNSSVIIVEDSKDNGDKTNVIIIEDDENVNLKAKCDEGKLSEVAETQQNEDLKINDSANITENEKSKTDSYKELMEDVIARKLPEHLSKIKHKIVEILSNDRIFRLTRASIIMNTKNKLQSLPEKKDVKKISPEKSIKPEPKSKFEPSTVIPYYVRITGKPYLPKKKQMHKFLSNFNPRTIKKHKSLPHLLFVGFMEKDNHDKILAANDTVIANAKLTIKNSERVNHTNKMDSQANTNENVDTALAKDQEDDLVFINPELDEKISELISSIRKEQEEEQTENNTECGTSESKPDNVVNDVDENVKYDKNPVMENNIDITKTLEDTNAECEASKIKPENIVSKVEVEENVKCGDISAKENNLEITETVKDNNATSGPSKPDNIKNEDEDNISIAENNPEIIDTPGDKRIKDDIEIDLTEEDNEEIEIIANQDEKQNHVNENTESTKDNTTN